MRIRWDRYEVALLFRAYKRMEAGNNINDEAAALSTVLRKMAISKGTSIDDTYRNVNGMKMQLATVQYLFTNGQKGLSGASSMIRQMYELYTTHHEEYQIVLQEAIQIAGISTTSIEDAFLVSASDEKDENDREDDTNHSDRIILVTADAFPNGIRPASIIDINKLKRCYESRYNEVLPDSTDITAVLQEHGFRSGEKVYILTDEQKRTLSDLIQVIFAEGHRLVYYSELLYQHSEILESCHLYDAPLMRTVFDNLLPNTICKADCILADRNANEIEEISRAFGGELVLTYQQIKTRCPYLTLSVIKNALSRSSRFVWSSTETFAQTDLIQLDPKEVQKIQQDVLPQMQNDGYFSLANLSLEESCAMNPQISFSAVRDAVFIRHMAFQCDRNGLIATPKGIHATSAQILVGWCKSKEELTLAELEAYERELTGHHAVLGISAACSSMVRIDHDHFVSDALIDFDIEAVDRAIALFAENRIIPITAITSFTSLPDVPGYSWNLYLVESFLRRFSKCFTIDGGPAQMSFVGGICPASMQFDSYDDRMAQAVIQDGVLLTEDSIGRYLTEKKYILRRSDTVRKVLSKALVLNSQRGDSNVRL